MGRAYENIWGQCSQQMRAKVESSNNYDVVHNNSDLLGLLRLIKISSFDFHSQKNSFHGLIDVEKAFKNFRQPKTMSCEDYHEKFKSLSEAYVSCGGSIGKEEGLVEEELIHPGKT